MRTLLALLPIALLAACATSPTPDAGPYASMNCAALEAERVRVVTEFDALHSTEAAQIETKKAEIEAIGNAQVAKGCAG